jgi:non-specific serine/threonine protein kinase
MPEMDRPIPSLSIRLFGPFDVQVNGQPLPRLRSRNGQWLLALLVLRHDREVSREWLAGLLWPESTQSLAYANLRRSLNDLRHALGPAAHRLRSPAPHSLCLDLSGADCDVLAFDAAIARGLVGSRPISGSPAACDSELERAVNLYRGSLLEGCAEEWALPEREEREQAYLQALERLAARAMQAGGDPAAAIRYLRRAAAVDPTRESIQRALMQTLAASGDYASATLVYRDLRLLLHRDLNAEPDPETVVLFQQIRREARGKAARSSGRVPYGSPAPSRHSSTPLPRLPRPLTELIGREQEVREVVERVTAVRLVTLTGAGGVGKTRLAIKVAEELIEDYRDGVWFVELAALSDPAFVPQAVASALGLRETSGRPLAETIAEYLRDQQALLVLDNCEHLLMECTRLTDIWLRDCPRLKILATSRHSMGIAGEAVWRVPSLLVPSAQAVAVRQKDRLSALIRYEAIRLFVQRTVHANPDFRVTPANIGAIAQVCQQLDGIPLALELAAARMKAMSVEQIAARLADRFGLLTGGSRTALPRHQTLEATMDWSYGLLSAPEQALLRRLSMFAGGWTLEAAEAVCAQNGGVDSVEIGEVLDPLSSLVDKSLVVYEEWGGTPRYRLLETVRQYAQERLQETGELEAVQERHRDFFLRLAQHTPPSGDRLQPQWLDRLESELDNFRSAFATCRAAPHGGQGMLRLAVDLEGLWGPRGYTSEGRAILSAALERKDAQEPTEVRARALSLIGEIARTQSEYDMARRYLEESLALWRTLSNPFWEGWTLIALGWNEQCLGKYEAAGRLHEEALAISRAAGIKFIEAFSLTRLGDVARRRGAYDISRHYLDESLALWRTVGYIEGIALTLAGLGAWAYKVSEYTSSSAWIAECLGLCREMGSRRVAVLALETSAQLAHALQNPQRAARLFAANQSLREAITMPTELDEREEIEGVLAEVEAALSEDDLAAAWAEGYMMTPEQAIAYALSAADADLPH